MTTSILITVLGSKDFKCDLGNFIRELQELTGECIWGILKKTAENTLQWHRRNRLCPCYHLALTATGVCWSASSRAACRAPSHTLPVCFCPGQRVIHSPVSVHPQVTPKLIQHPLSCRLKAHRSNGLCSCTAVCRNPGQSCGMCRNPEQSWSCILDDRTSSREQGPRALLLLQGWFPCALSSFISVSQQHKWRVVAQVIALVHLNHLP